MVSLILLTVLALALVAIFQSQSSDRQRIRAEAAERRILRQLFDSRVQLKVGEMWILGQSLNGVRRLGGLDRTERSSTDGLQDFHRGGPGQDTIPCPSPSSLSSV